MSAYPVGIVGESVDNDDGSSRQDEIRKCAARQPVTLVRDPANKYDANCVKVISARGVQIGNISRDDDWICERMDRGGYVDARILEVRTGQRAKGVVLCVRTAEDDDWLTDDEPSAGVDPPNTGCFVAIVLLLMPTMLRFGGL
jgi:HIRAN domain-containing protein